MNKMYISVETARIGWHGAIEVSRIVSKHNKLGCMVEAWERIQRSKMPKEAKDRFTMHLFDGTRFLKMGDNFYRSEENGANPLVYWR